MSARKKKMGRSRITPTGVEREWGADEIIVTKTDLSGKLTYTNDVFLRVAGLTEEQALGKPHNIIRHPEMPRAVFRLLWTTIKAQREIFAYVNNLATNGDHYWVFAHVTPSVDAAGKVVGYHSNRRKPDPEQIARITPIYALLLAEEAKHSVSEEAVQASTQLLQRLLEEKGMTYDQFVFTI